MAEAAAEAVAVPARPADLNLRLRLEQFRLLFLQYRRVTLPLVFVTLGVAYIVSGHAPTGWVVAWAVVNVVMPVVRWWVCRRYFDSTEKVARYHTQATWLAYSALLPGIWTGLAAPLFLPWLPPADQAILTMIFACTVAGALASSAAFPPTFYSYGSTVLVLLAGSWLASDSEIGAIIALMLMMLLVILVAFVRDNGKMVRESIRIRFEREPMLEEQRRLIDLLQDASDRAEAARGQAEEANRAKSRFLASASHDLRQPLHAISLLSSVLGEVSGDRTTREIADQLSRSVDSLDRLFSALLDLSKLDAGVLVPLRTKVDIAAAFGPLLHEYEQRAHARGLDWHIAIDDGVAVMDAILVERILRNLLDNAIKYTAAGSVSTTIGHTGDAIVLRVADTGTGIPESEHRRIYEEFYQISNPERDRRNGLGLGLAIVKRLVALLEGTISLASKPGRGAAFEIRLPDGVPGEPSAYLSEDRIDNEAIDLGGLTVLVIDDDLEVRDAMSLTLRHWNCLAQVARDETEAMALASRGDVDVIISDYRLAGGVLGTSVLRNLLGARPRASGLLITGDIASAELAVIEESGFPLLHKPVHYRKLKAMLREARRKSEHEKAR